MKVSLINTADSGGGAAVACKRLLNALRNKVQVNMLVQYKSDVCLAIISVLKHKLDFIIAKLNFLRERISFIAFYEKNKTVRFAFSTANVGIDISKNRVITQSDILHFHWINQGFLSLNNLQKLFDLNKPIVFTLHDMWAFTGGCHYAGKCTHFMQQCGNCKFLTRPYGDDISKKGWMLKQQLFARNSNITFVACSHWMAQQARKSSLLQNFNIQSIPNPIDTTLYKPLNKSEIRKKWGLNADAKIILFGAANINDKRKGIAYLLEALNILKKQYPNQMLDIVLFGKNKGFDSAQIPFSTISLPIITNEQALVEIYNLASVFVLPSLEDNLPNMVIEALACGIPVVAFNQGGIPEMIDHQQNGYVAQYQSSNDFAQGIHWVLHNKGNNLQKNALKKVMDTYAEDIIAKQYIDLYQSVLK
ncbi:MAG: glycosyltransferase [Sphingobacteriales bacterium]|nr:MAG: glycosyltransferase [Sphingobacteriales bacterium]